MKNRPASSDGCPDCAPSRRAFLQTGALGAAALALGGVRAADEPVRPAADSETLCATLFKSLSEEQKKDIVMPFDHPLRSKVDANWHITKKTVSDFKKDQQAMIRDIFVSLHSPEYAERVLKQVESDNSIDDGFGGCSIAMFGEPGEAGKSKFEFVFTGRHVTRRCDGNSVAGAVFGGPIFYGHEAGGSMREQPDHPGNIYWYQGVRANEVFKALDGKQRELALRSDPRPEQGNKTVELSGKDKLTGVPMTELSRDQKDLVRKVMSDVLAPFRKVDADEALKVVEQNNGFDKLHMSFFKNMDIGNDGVWDVWQIEGPSMLWYFRGSPHVHTWVNIREQA